MQRLQHRRHRVARRREQRRADHLQVVVHQVDLAAGVTGPEPGQHGGHVRGAHHLVVRPGDRPELPGREHRHHLVGLDRALPDRGQNHPVPASPQLRNERRHHVLDAAVVRRRHGQPRPGIDQHAQRRLHQAALLPVPVPDMNDAVLPAPPERSVRRTFPGRAAPSPIRRVGGGRGGGKSGNVGTAGSVSSDPDSRSSTGPIPLQQAPLGGDPAGDLPAPVVQHCQVHRVWLGRRRRTGRWLWEPRTAAVAQDPTTASTDRRQPRAAAVHAAGSPLVGRDRRLSPHPPLWIGQWTARQGQLRAGSARSLEGGWREAAGVRRRRQRPVGQERQ